MGEPITMQQYVQQLLTAGYYPAPEIIEPLLASGTAAHPDLLLMASNVSLFAQAEPACWAPIHALRLLEYLQPDASIIEPLLAVMPYLGESVIAQIPATWNSDLPHTLAAAGAAGIPLLCAAAAQAERNPMARGAALTALAVVADRVPSERDAIIAQLRQWLSDEQDPVNLAFVVYALALLRVQEVYPDVMAAYRSHRIEREIFDAAAARQMLLSRQPSPFLDRLGFWERYDDDEQPT